MYTANTTPALIFTYSQWHMSDMQVCPGMCSGFKYVEIFRLKTPQATDTQEQLFNFLSRVSAITIAQHSMMWRPFPYITVHLNYLCCVRPSPPFSTSPRGTDSHEGTLELQRQSHKAMYCHVHCFACGAVVHLCFGFMHNTTWWCASTRCCNHKYMMTSNPDRAGSFNLLHVHVYFCQDPCMYCINFNNNHDCCYGSS